MLHVTVIDTGLLSVFTRCLFHAHSFAKFFFCFFCLKDPYIHTCRYAGMFQLLYDQYEWSERDLASLDRTKTPWLIVMAHRTLYCTKEGDPAHSEWL